MNLLQGYGGYTYIYVYVCICMYMRILCILVECRISDLFASKSCTLTADSQLYSGDEHRAAGYREFR